MSPNTQRQHFNCRLKEPDFHFWGNTSLVHSQAKPTMLLNTIRIPMAYKTDSGAYESMIKIPPWSDHCQQSWPHLSWSLPCSTDTKLSVISQTYHAISHLLAFLLRSHCLLGIPTSLLRAPLPALLSLSQSLTKCRLLGAVCPSAGNKGVQCLQKF